MKGMALVFKPEGALKGSKAEPAEGDAESEERDPARVALDGLKAAIEEDDPKLLAKAFKLLQRCCADDEEDSDEEV